MAGVPACLSMNCIVSYRVQEINFFMCKEKREMEAEQDMVSGTGGE